MEIIQDADRRNEQMEAAKVVAIEQVRRFRTSISQLAKILHSNETITATE